MIIPNEPSKKTSLVCAVISVLLIVSMGAVIINEIVTYDYPPELSPNQSFVILDKKVVQNWQFLIFPIDIYLFQYGVHPNAWIEVEKSDYNANQIGDVFDYTYQIFH